MENLNYEERPWGSFEILLDSTKCKVKEIIVNPDQRLSYQSHKFRQEVWTVTEGVLTVVLEGKTHSVPEGHSIRIPLGHKHRAWNRTSTPVKFIEVQTGTYFGEDDIIRFEDDYSRGEFDHLADGNYIGGLTMPKSNTNKLK